MIPIYTIKLGKKEKQYVNLCLDTGWISSSGSFVGKFEEAFAKFIGVKYALAVVNGTSALHLLALASGIKKDDEVIIPDYTFISTALSISYTGAKVVPIDADKDTWNIDPKQIEKAITNKTKAIIPVDIYGLPANYEEIEKIAKKHNLLILEDSAEAFGSKYKRKMAGSFGDGAIFSLYGNKTITTGEGGMLVTNSKKIYENAKLLSNYGREKKGQYINKTLGFNYHMTNIQGAIGLAQIEKADKVIKRKIEIKNLYQKFLKDIPGISFQKEDKNSINVCWLISIVIDEKDFGKSKDKLSEELNKKGIDTRNFFYPIHLQPMYRLSEEKTSYCSNEVRTQNESTNTFPISNYLYKSGLSLPSYPSLKNEEIKLICKITKNLYLKD